MNYHRIFSYSISLFTFLLLLGCSYGDNVSKMEQENIATIRYIHSELAKGNVDAFDEVLAPNYIRHCQAMPPELQEMHGSEQLKVFCKDFYAAVSDYSETLDVILADSDKVAYVLTMKAKQTGPMSGLPVSGKVFECVNIIIQRFENGKIAETWVSWDNMAMLSQLGFLPPE